VHPGGIVKRTTFHVMKMYSDRLAPNVIDCWYDGDLFETGDGSVPALDAVATADDERRRIVLALVNRHPEKELRCRVRVNGREPAGVAEAVVLAGDGPDAFNDVEAPHRVAPETVALSFQEGAVALRPHSITICDLPAV
jgi:alpha-N-arabinofuranosidase